MRYFFTIANAAFVLLLSAESSVAQSPNQMTKVSIGNTISVPGCPDTYPIPAMYVDYKTSIARRQWYHDHQLQHYNSTLSKANTEEILLAVDDFKSFLKGILDAKRDSLRIYIASYPGRARGVTIPHGSKKKLTIAFAPVNKGESEKEFYVLDPMHQYRFVEGKKKNKWFKHYNKKRMDIPGSDEKDTRCIKYDSTQLGQFAREIACQEPSAIKVFFSAYRDKSMEAPEVQKYCNRLSIQFALIDASGKEINLEDQSNYSTRLDHTPKTDKGGFNNGTLCPPCVNCPPSYPGCSK